MIESKETLTGNIVSKQTITGELNVAEVKVLPALEDITIIPTTVQKVFKHENSYGYDKVTVEPIPDEYTIPTGTLEITTNGEHNVKDYEKVVADIHEVSKYAPRYISFYGYTQSELQQELDNLSFENMTETRNMFYSVSSLQNIDFSSIDLSTITSFYNMCYGCRGLKTINFGNSGGKPTRFESTFYNCRALEGLDLSSFDGSNINTMRSMCYANYALKSVVLPSNLGKDTSVDFQKTFQNCSALEELDLSYINCKFHEAHSFCSYCTNLKRIDLRNITNAYSSSSVLYMFEKCSSLEYLDIRSLDLSKHTSNYVGMLDDVPTTCEIIVKDDANKQWFAEKFSTYTNVKTVAEIGG